MFDSTSKVRKKTQRFWYSAGPGHQEKDQRKWPST